MWTEYYKGCYIHGYTDRDNCRVSFCHGYGTRKFKTLRGAKIAITLFKNKGG
jgi:hypothetical protein